MTLTARGRTPDAAESLLIDATDTLDGILRQLVVRVPTLVADPGTSVVGQVDQGVHLTDQYLRTCRRLIRSGVYEATDGMLG
ncbi:hypothetical protein [Rhodococcus sp. OK302]|uniref:hypothetical protein n=1 Tax=Rhodococcus sp. OK302 TaxID=1882769 RepID=UPI000B93AE2B|nr:hypothetical protein [Rhodococcus sp. OK302]OYD70268.1 hypothetical protein BDB13_3868 [Rhodococcus sp. OK302]